MAPAFTSIPAVVAALTMLAQGGADVRGAARCPTAARVAQRLDTLLSSDAAMPEGTWLEIDDAAAPAGGPAQIEIRLVRGAARIASRRLPSYASCDEAADALAVVAATWLTRYQALPPPLALPAPPPPPPPSPQAAVVATRAMPATARNAGALMLSVAVGSGVVAAGSGSSAPFLSAELDGQRWVHARARLLVAGIDLRTMPVAPGTLLWRRLVASPGLGWGWGTAAASAELGVGALVGAAFLEGRGFTRDDHAVSLDLGLAPWVRAGARLAAFPITFWVSASALAWAREQRGHVDGGAAEGTLPRVDLMLGGGVAWLIGD